MRTRCTTLVALALVVLALGACSVSTTSSESDDGTPLDDGPTDLLHERGAAARAIAAIEEKVGASPARAGEILVYPEHMDVEAQDPAITEHIDEFEWRDDSVTGPTPVALSGPQEDVEASLFPTSTVRWRDIPDVVAEVEARARRAKPLRIEQAKASYLIVQRSTSSEDDGRVEISIYLNGPRRSGNAELTASGEIINLTVN
ncbi:MAG: hypothetical protein WEC34_15835 [Acidimicrobiia bacterium]